MNNEEVIAWTRKEATLSSKSTEFSSTVINQMANQVLELVFSPLVENCRAGFWYHTFTRTLGTGNPYVRLPPRTFPAIEQVDVSMDGQHWAPLTEALESEQTEWMADYGANAIPTAYVIRGSSLYLLPAARVDGCQLRVKASVRPSTLVSSQAGVGVITDIDYDNRVLELTSLPVDRLAGDTTIVSGAICDVIEPRAQFELSLVDAQVIVVDPTHVQVAAGHTLARLEIGDYLRVAGQSDWPQLPISFHSLLGTITAIPIARQRDLLDRAQMLSTAASASLQRLEGHLKPRVRVDVHKVLQHQWGR